MGKDAHLGVDTTQHMSPIKKKAFRKMHYRMHVFTKRILLVLLSKQYKNFEKDYKRSLQKVFEPGVPR